MKFLDELRAYLERPEVPGPIAAPDLAAHRRHLLGTLENLERLGLGEQAILNVHTSLRDADLKDFVETMARALLMGLGHGSSDEGIAKLVGIAMDRAVGLLTSTGSSVKDAELDRLHGEVRSAINAGLSIPRYAREIRAVRRTGDVQVVTTLGRLILELPERDAVRWILAAEVVQTLGPKDEWRISREAATHLLEESEGSWDEDIGALGPFQRTLKRLSALGMAHVWGFEGSPTIRYKLPPEGRPLLEEIASGKDTPFLLLARALLQDETASVLGQFPVAAALVRQESAAAVATRHARLVAHEVRNALVPVRVTLGELYEEIERRGQSDVLDRRRSRIDGGIARVFRFARDVVLGTNVAPEPIGPFNLQPAIESALAAIRPEIERDLAFVQEAPLPPVLGYRDRFILALVNILRNAAQAREQPPVQIRITAGVNNGAEVFVCVDDDGPGVAAEDRTKVFASGFSKRPGGSGHGLALAREVVEEEMRGRVVCEESPLGGARFVVRLPVGNKRTL